MADHTFLDWPFFNDSHRILATKLEKWAEIQLNNVPYNDVDARCRKLVAALGQDGWLELDILKGTLKLKDISSTVENEYKEPMDNDTLFRRQADFFLNKFSLEDDSYCQALLTNATVVDQCLIQISQ